MKEIIFSTIAIVLISVAAAYGLKALNWDAASTYSSSQVRL